MYYNRFFKILAFFLIVTFYNFSVFTYSFALNCKGSKEIDITAHRGSSISAPENTISSIVLAMNEKAEYIEIDARTTSDNVVVLSHDNSLMRLASVDKNISDSTYEEIKNIDVGSFFSAKYCGETIPTLDNVLELTKGKIKVNIDMKINGESDILPKLVAKLIEKYKCEDSVSVSSTSYDAIKKVKKMNPNIKIGYIVSSMPKNIDINYIDFISIEFEGLNKEVINIMHKCNKEVYVWTLDNKEQVIKAIELGVDNIITDNVNMVKNIINISKAQMWGDI